MPKVKKLFLAIGSLVVGTYTLLANGGAWQTGVPGTGSASASNKGRQTNVTIEDETLKIDLRSSAGKKIRTRISNPRRATSSITKSALTEKT